MKAVSVRNIRQHAHLGILGYLTLGYHISESIPEFLLASQIARTRSLCLLCLLLAACCTVSSSNTFSSMEGTGRWCVLNVMDTQGGFN